MISALLETPGVLLLVGLGVVAGLWSSRLKKPWWICAYLAPLVMVSAIALVRQKAWLAFVAGFSLITAGRNEYVILSFALPMLLSTLIPRLNTLRKKVLVSILIAVASINLSVLPFLVPAFVINKLAALETTFVGDVCIQSTGYTCGPACAVTALKALGIDADEGQLAIAARTTSVCGTPDDMLKKAIEKLYGSQGVQCLCRYYDSIEQLNGDCPVIAIIKYAPLIDHYITILEVTSENLVVGDPLNGKMTMSHEEFKQKWRFVGIEVRRTNNQNSVNNSMAEELI